MDSLLEQSCRATLHVAMSFQLAACINIKITNIRGTTVLLYEFAAKKKK